MNEKKIKSLIEILKTTIKALEDEVKSNPQSYISTHDFSYSSILDYYNTNDDDGEY